MQDIYKSAKIGILNKDNRSLRNLFYYDKKFLLIILIYFS